MKKNSIKLIIIFSAICVVSTTLFALCLMSYNNILLEAEKTQIDYDTLPDTKLEHTNNIQKYTRKEIETIDYKMGFKNVYEYKGIYFVSTVDGISDIKLHEMAIELFDNIHGEEMNYVSLVELSPGDGMFCYGRQYDILMLYETPVSLYNFLGENSYNIAGERSHLVVDNVSGDLMSQDMAQALSVAYGYHFIKYYDILKGDEDDYESEYYKLRGQGNEDVRVIIEDNDDYMDNSKWYLEHIAAYDYMYLLGSKQANRILTQHGIGHVSPIASVEQLSQFLNGYYKNGRNTTPHINIDLTLPDAVEGLSEYLYSFVDTKAPVYESEIESFGPIYFSNRYVQKHFVTENVYIYRSLTIDRYASFKPIFDDPDIVMSVLIYNMDDEFIRVSSVVKGNVDKAFIGGWRKFEFDYSIYTYDTREEGEFKVRFLAAYPDGQIAISEPYVFMHP